MTDIQPIPGVVYMIQFGDEQHNDADYWVYSPWGPVDDDPWIDAVGNFRALTSDHRVVKIHYNPHGPATFRNHNFCPGCAEAMPDLPTDQPQPHEEVQS